MMNLCMRSEDDFSRRKRRNAFFVPMSIMCPLDKS